MAILDNLFGAPPEYLTGLLGADATDKLRKQAMTTGLVNSAIALIAQPRNQRYGSALPYIGKALMAGQQAGQNVYGNALQGLETQQKLAEYKRQQEQRAAREDAISKLPADQQQMYRAYGEAAVPFLLKKPERKTQTIGNQIVDITDEPKVLFTGEKELKASPTRERQSGRIKIQEELQPDGTWKEIGRGAMDAPKQQESISYKTETDADGNLVYVPNKPGFSTLNSQGQPVNYKPASGIKLTEDQAKASGWLSQATNAYNNMIKASTIPNTEIKTGAESPNFAEAGLSAIGLEGAANLTRNESRQQFVQATESLSEALLRAATGAGVNESEAKQKIKELTPQWSDKPSNRQQKLDAIPQYIESLRTRAGQGGVNIEPPIGKIDIIPSGSKMPTAKPIPKVGEVKNGYVFKGGNPNDSKSWIKKGK